MRRRTFLAASAATLALPSVATPQNQRVLKFIPQSDLAILDPVWTTAYVTMHGPVTATPESPLEATLTFKGAVRLPSSVTLPPGTYHFQMVSPNLLRITSADGRAKVLATFATTTVTRTRDLDQPLVRFERTAYDRPPRLMAIFPENASVGYELSMPDDRRALWAVATTGTR